MSITHHFKNSAGNGGYGYYGYIEDGQLVIGENWPREGGIVYRGTYREVPVRYMEELKTKATRLYNSITKYYSEVAIEPKTASPSGTLWKVKLHMDNGTVHKCLVRGTSESSIIMKLLPPIPTVHTIQSYTAEVFAVRSERISAIEFVKEW